MKPLNNGHRYVPQIDAIAANERSLEIREENDPETIHLAYLPMEGLGNMTGVKVNSSRRPKGLYCKPWSEGLKDLPTTTIEKDRSYPHGALPTPMKVLLQQWKNVKQCRKWEAKQLCWTQLMRAMNACQKTGDAAMLRWEEMEDSEELMPTTADPLDALMQEEQDAIREESRQYRMALLMRSLTKRQRRALELRALGLTERQIAKKTRSSQKTINREIAKISDLAKALRK